MGQGFVVPDYFYFFFFSIFSFQFLSQIWARWRDFEKTTSCRFEGSPCWGRAYSEKVESEWESEREVERARVRTGWERKKRWRKIEEEKDILQRERDKKRTRQWKINQLHVTFNLEKYWCWFINKPIDHIRSPKFFNPKGQTPLESSIVLEREKMEWERERRREGERKIWI